MMMRLGIVLCMSLFAWNYSGNAKNLKLVLSVAPQQYFVERIAADTVDVEVLIPAGSNPHTYQPTAKQMAFLSQADAYFKMGLPFENSILHKVKAHFKGEVIDLRKGLDLMQSDDHHHEHDDVLDPHTWLDPAIAAIQARQMAEAIIRLMPENRDLYESQLRELLIELDDLDATLHEILKPLYGRDLLVFHPAWAYFAHRYGLHQVAVESHGKAPGARHIVQLIKGMNPEIIPLLLIQPQFNKRVAEIVAEELGIKVIEADPLAGNYVENLLVLAEALASSSSAEN